MATTRKILSKGLIKQVSATPIPERNVASKKEIEEREAGEVDVRSTGSGGEERSGLVRTKKVCQFCSNKTEPHYFDMVALRRFINDRGRIVARTRSGSCAKHQRRITKEIKRARHLALLPFTVRV